VVFALIVLFVANQLRPGRQSCREFNNHAIRCILVCCWNKTYRFQSRNRCFNASCSDLISVLPPDILVICDLLSIKPRTLMNALTERTVTASKDSVTCTLSANEVGVTVVVGLLLATVYWEFDLGIFSWVPFLLHQILMGSDPQGTQSAFCPMQAGNDIVWADTSKPLETKVRNAFGRSPIVLCCHRPRAVVDKAEGRRSRSRDSRTSFDRPGIFVATATQFCSKALILLLSSLISSSTRCWCTFA